MFLVLETSSLLQHKNSYSRDHNIRIWTFFIITLILNDKLFVYPKKTKEVRPEFIKQNWYKYWRMTLRFE
jgi:hypothetical protein